MNTATKGYKRYNVVGSRRTVEDAGPYGVPIRYLVGKAFMPSAESAHGGRFVNRPYSNLIILQPVGEWSIRIFDKFFIENYAVKRAE